MHVRQMACPDARGQRQKATWCGQFEDTHSARLMATAELRTTDLFRVMQSTMIDDHKVVL